PRSLAIPSIALSSSFTSMLCEHGLNILTVLLLYLLTGLSEQDIYHAALTANNWVFVLENARNAPISTDRHE
ncbi:MAG: hypothetical protein LM585_03500, partial [Fervidicoccaceae archaeon]|nr:hypothetical protein [Fervidicoccaceae archaeon]